MHSHTMAGEQAVATTGSVIHWAQWYDSVVSVLTLGQSQALRNQTVALANISAGEIVLDVGCGTGELTRLARIRTGSNGQVMGLDASPEMIQVARRNAAAQGLEIDFRLGVIEALPFPDNTIDVVLSSLMMHHLPGELKALALGEIQRVLKPNGRLVIVDIKRPSGKMDKMANALLMHGGVKSGIQDLAPLVQATGLVGIETGAVSFPMLGYLRATKADFV